MWSKLLKLSLAGILGAALVFLIFSSATALGPLLWQQTCPTYPEITGGGPNEVVTTYFISCYDVDPTPEPTPTPLPEPIDPYQNAPACTNHDPLIWHELWNSEFGCHYDHHHGDNPHVVDAIFGTEWFTQTGGDMQMPWQPAGTSPVDTARKHYGLFWKAETGLPCYSRYTGACITDYRAEVHALSDVYDIFRPGPTGSMHVARLEARVCLENDPTNCGIIRLAGVQYLGDTIIDRVTLWDVPEPYEMGWPRGAQPVNLGNWNVGNRLFASWYPVHTGAIFRVATEFGDVWNQVNPTDPFNVQFIYGNQSRIKLEILGIDLAGVTLRVVNADNDDYVNYQGFLTRLGAFSTTCTEPIYTGDMCLPVSFENVPIPSRFNAGINQFQYNGPYKEYDVFFNNVSSGWIQHPGLP